ncbi:MAG TPA: hypothetical protein VF167_18410 [Longimicrobiaceae bacterium]
MAIVPIYRLRAELKGSRATVRRYRFSREPTPCPNPHPGEDNEDPETKWICEGVAFYAWSDQMENGVVREELQPVYEFHRCTRNRHQYYYSLDKDRPDGPGWKKRPYVAFWAHAEDVEDGAPPVYRYKQDTSRENYALSVDPEVEGWTREEQPAFYASERVPVRVSVRPRENGKGKRKGNAQFDWTFDPSTVNLAYGSVLEFVPAPTCSFVFTDFKIHKGEEDFDEPEIHDERVQVRARCTTRGKDYKYMVGVRLNGHTEDIVGDPEIVNQAPTKL